MLLTFYIKLLQKIISKHGDLEIKEPDRLILKDDSEMSYRIFKKKRRIKNN